MWDLLRKTKYEMVTFIVFKIGKWKYSRIKTGRQTSREIGTFMKRFARNCELCEEKYEVL